jgi:hypothetical protein
MTVNPISSHPLPARAASLRAALLDDHHRIDVLGSRVTTCVNADDQHGALEEWRAFERALLAHMDGEEMYLLPRFAEVDTSAAGRLREEHAVIRAELGAIAMALELHIARKPMFDALEKRLREHAKAEDMLMYAWADRDLPERLVGIILRHLHRG